MGSTDPSPEQIMMLAAHGGAGLGGRMADVCQYMDRFLAAALNRNEEATTQRWRRYLCSQVDFHTARDLLAQVTPDVISRAASDYWVDIHTCTVGRSRCPTCGNSGPSGLFEVRPFEMWPPTIGSVSELCGGRSLFKGCTRCLLRLDPLGNGPLVAVRWRHGVVVTRPALRRAVDAAHRKEKGRRWQQEHPGHNEVMNTIRLLLICDHAGCDNRAVATSLKQIEKWFRPCWRYYARHRFLTPLKTAILFDQIVPCAVAVQLELMLDSWALEKSISQEKTT